MRIALLADSHIPHRLPCLPGEPARHWAGCAALLHAGDLTDPAVLDELSALAPTVAVRGNCDLAPRLAGLPTIAEQTFGEFRLGLLHGHQAPRPPLGDRAGLPDYCRRLAALVPAAGIIVFGHLHRRVKLELDGRLFLNPGALAEGDWAELHLEPDSPPRVEFLRMQPQ